MMLREKMGGGRLAACYKKEKKGKKDKNNKIKSHDMDFNCHNKGKTYDEGKKMFNE